MFDEQPTLKLLFDQLGLDSDQASIDQFVATHQLPQGAMLHEASFWSDSQREFIASHWRKDDDWALVIDELNELLADKS
ncbi:MULTISPECIES: DUF2789 family protein [Acinetobacter]|uniref:DUF2789 domain-containing protein n=1 Tax=Acinetobacter piscicola TaxID=2006115 RepID=A0A4Q4GYR9_9GAMM|nr:MULTISPECIES: DUF2789 family protein [Acinetobacter]MDM1758249.1 DUF2789 domain-containing protein [Acinetobacter sp. 256-1]MDM1760964.1 DUF2789 domain-containing protein [Acinetobacter sp. 251-1]QOW44947.1 DUF2789 domain-containing protein [Acinetobacter piscicola]RYL25661.1 DUF2789 domain-containing protein [Acinetobacter piscicola]